MNDKKVQKIFFAFNAAHDHKDTNVEYLPMSVSSDKKTGTFNVSTLSPFVIVYKDVKKAEPSSDTYVLPKTGD